MNWTQWLVIAGPLLPLYVYWICAAERGGERRLWANARDGLIGVPFIYCFLPFILCAIVRDQIRERRWRTAAVAALILCGFYAGLGWGCYALRERPAPPAELQVERPAPR